jgi:hypothetical protein
MSDTNRLLAIDPGTRGCGAAFFVDGSLCVAAYVPNPVKKGSGPGECARMAQAVVDWCATWPSNVYVVDALALEIPQIYSRGKSKGDPNNIMPLFGVVSAIAALHPMATVEWERPRGWKGNTPKPDSAKAKYVIKERVIERLSERELDLVAWPSLNKNTDVARKQDFDVADACGIGMHILGRFERVRAFARE